MRFRGKTAAGVVFVALAACALAWYLLPNGKRAETTATTSADSSGYVNAAQCRGCHEEIYRTYQQVGMARSFHAVADASKEPPEAKVVHAKSGRTYEIVRRDGRLVQRRYEPNGANAFELEATHAVGSANHAITYLHRTAGGELVQLPLTWYTQDRAWGMSPGYDQPKPADFTRLVDDSCLFCHNGYPSATDELASGIDCQRCHGPGAEHIRLASTSNPDATKVRAAVVNPKRLSTDLQMDVCMQCHLETTSSELPQMLRRFDRTAFSYRPGEPLGAYMIHFDHPKGTGHDDKFEIVNQAYRMRQSACFRESEGRMTCTSCHNPHDVPRGEQAVAYYRAKCLECHTSLTAARHPDPKTSDCVACHMPKRRAQDVVRVVMTDHLVQRKPPAGALAPLQEQTSAYRGPLNIYLPANLPAQDRDLYLGVALYKGGADPHTGRQLLEKAASGDIAPPRGIAVLGESYLSGGAPEKAIPAFERALAKQPDNTIARYNLGKALEAAGRTADARAAFEEALQRQAFFPEAESALANLLLQTGDSGAAEQHYLRAIQQRPMYAEPRNNLGNLYAAAGRLDEARTQLEQALRIDPSFAEAYSNLGRVLALQGRPADALATLRRAVSLKPDAVEARFNLAQVLQQTGAENEAIAEYRTVLRQKPSMPEAHLALGQALGNAGRIDAAIAEFREVLRLRPGHPEAERNLAMALEMTRTDAR